MCQVSHNFKSTECSDINFINQVHQSSSPDDNDVIDDQDFSPTENWDSKVVRSLGFQLQSSKPPEDCYDEDVYKSIN